MLRLPQFKYLSPQSVNEAGSFLKEYNEIWEHWAETLPLIPGACISINPRHGENPV